MTNKERYKQAFGTLHASENLEQEVTRMKKTGMKAYRFRIAAAVFVLVITLGGMTTIYAANVGGIQEKLKFWFHGEEKTVSAVPRGDHSYDILDENGEMIIENITGMIGADGSADSRYMTAEEILAEDYSDIYEDDEGRIIFTNGDVKIDITDLMDQKGFCKIACTTHGIKLYYDIEYQNDNSFAIGSAAVVEQDELEEYIDVDEQK